MNRQQGSEEVDAGSMQAVLTLSNNSQSPELWGPLIRTICLDDHVRVKTVIRDFWRWRHGTNRINLPFRDTIEQASRLWIKNIHIESTDVAVLFTSALRNSDKAFAKFIVKVNTDRPRRSTIRIERRAYIAKVLYYCRHTYQDEECLLAIVEVYATTSIPGVPWPYRTEKREKRI